MPRLFIRHKPIEHAVEDSVVSSRFYVSREILQEHGIEYMQHDYDATYVCIVNAGECWAARYFQVMGNKQVRIDCVPFSDNQCGKEMILADMILN